MITANKKAKSLQINKILMKTKTNKISTRCDDVCINITYI